MVRSRGPCYFEKYPSNSGHERNRDCSLRYPGWSTVAIERIEKLKADVEAEGLYISVIESVPVHESIKLGRPDRDQYISAYKSLN